MAPLTTGRAVTSWQLDSPVLVVVLALGCFYLIGVWRVRRQGRDWPVWRTASFVALGLGSVVVVTMSGLGVYDQILFWPRAVQYSVLLSVSPLLLAIGEPLELARQSVSGSVRQRLDAVLRSRPVRTLAFPLVGAVLGVLVLLLVYFTPLYRASLTGDTTQGLVCLGLLVSGLVFFGPMLDVGEELLPSWCGYGMRVVFAFLDSLLDAVPGVVIMTMNGVIAKPYYAALHRDWGPSLQWDQTIGGGLMFTLSELVALPLLVVLVVRWMREDERRAHETDYRLDADTASTAPDGAARGVKSAEELPLSSRPWWENDPGPLAERPEGPPRSGPA